MLMLRASVVCLLYACSSVALLDLAGRVTAGDQVFSRSDFPPEFVFGAGSSAYQVEGAAFEDGRTYTIADALAHSGRFDGNGDVTCDQYHKYKEDVRLMVETGLEAYRFSISWARLIPHGKGLVNPKGLEYYNNLIDELVTHGIQPHITLLHQDLPMVLEDEYGGFSNPRIVEDFTAYADVCFREFGDRVRHWSSINEANLFAQITYYDWRRSSSLPRCSYPFKLNCTMKNVIVEDYDPYVVAHHALLAHASAARLYKEKYQKKQHGFFGFSLYAFHFVPFSNKTEDLMAVNRSNIFFMGWFMHPLMYGDYPQLMKTKLGARIPTFTKHDSKLVNGSSDFIGLNYYCVVMAKNASSSENDMEALWINFDGFDPLKEGKFANTPWGLQGALEYFKHVYQNPTIYIYENGQSTNYNSTIDDPSRVEYIEAHIRSLLEVVRNGSNTKGYFVWSFLDMFEYLYGYKNTFGLYYVDFKNSNLGRYAKLSQEWYAQFLRGKENSGVRKEDDVPHFLPISSQKLNDV